MLTAQWIIGSVLLVLSVVIIIVNWVLVIWASVTKKHVSAVPILGAVAGMLGFLALPVEEASRYWWIPLLIDYGFTFSILGAVYLCLFGPGKQETQR